MFNQSILHFYSQIQVAMHSILEEVSSIMQIQVYYKYMQVEIQAISLAITSQQKEGLSEVVTLPYSEEMLIKGKA